MLPAKSRSEDHSRFSWLLGSLLALILVFPLVESIERRGIVFEVFFTLILISAVCAVGMRQELFVGTVVFATLAVVGRWVSRFVESEWLRIGSGGFAAVFLLLVAVGILGHVLRAERINAQKVYGGICVYLLIGLAWAFLYAMILAAQPGSIEMPESDQAILPQTVYFSYITLTTLGYGDIRPVSTLARALASLEAIIGQLYLAVLVARLVGLHLMHDRSD